MKHWSAYPDHIRAALALAAHGKVERHFPAHQIARAWQIRALLLGKACRTQPDAPAELKAAAERVSWSTPRVSPSGWTVVSIPRRQRLTEADIQPISEEGNK